MDSRLQGESWTEEVICPICLDFFTDPVILDCEHNFCRSCITQSWGDRERNSCPECRQEIPDRNLRGNRALANLAEKARRLSLNPEEKESKHHCEEHQEELKLFCETDKKLMCVICRDSPEHKSHSFLPIKDAVGIYKEGSSRVQTDIKSEFVKMHQMLTEREQSLLRDIREQEENILKTMEQNLREIEENLNFLQQKLSKLEKQLEQKEGVIFLKEEASRKRRIRDDTKILSITDGILSTEKFDNLFPFAVWNTSKPVSVTLDVETANPYLEVSKDLKSFRCTKIRRSLTVTGKRFTDCLCVLGSEGFTSGRHYWEVEVVGNQHWRLGVAMESMERKGLISLIPENGFWIIEWDWDQLYVNFPRSPLTVSQIPKKVGVYLSYEAGTVSFYNANTKSHLHTFTGNKFTEKCYPFFGTWDLNKFLRICSGLDLKM
ncbi:nuclear factor 7, brain-like isoform X2 [Hemiscyllium ocellatum]|uniref:nuclear factor 7, brain-like isoform X2 n=1 Tax=Hemiscyllium ocellatum TaxID=170820 RepID=UPI0029676F75|nr:nuclear factor 7, brain-like isoform X2 [Hemiscyllium ocellatum]